MKCVDCELHDCVVSTHFCNYKGESGRRRPRRISEEDARKDVPCEYVEERSEDERGRKINFYQKSGKNRKNTMVKYHCESGSMINFYK